MFIILNRTYLHLQLVNFPLNLLHPPISGKGDVHISQFAGGNPLPRHPQHILRWQIRDSNWRKKRILKADLKRPPKRAPQSKQRVLIWNHHLYWSPKIIQPFGLFKTFTDNNCLFGLWKLFGRRICPCLTKFRLCKKTQPKNKIKV